MTRFLGELFLGSVTQWQVATEGARVREVDLLSKPKAREGGLKAGTGFYNNLFCKSSLHGTSVVFQEHNLDDVGISL